MSRSPLLSLASSQEDAMVACQRWASAVSQDDQRGVLIRSPGSLARLVRRMISKGSISPSRASSVVSWKRSRRGWAGRSIPRS